MAESDNRQSVNQTMSIPIPMMAMALGPLMGHGPWPMAHDRPSMIESLRRAPTPRSPLPPDGRPHSPVSSLFLEDIEDNETVSVSQAYSYRYGPIFTLIHESRAIASRQSPPARRARFQVASNFQNRQRSQPSANPYL